MSRLIRTVFALLLTLSVCSTALAGESIELRMKSGATWRGELNTQVEISFMEQGVQVAMVGKITRVNDQFIMVDGNIGGTRAVKPIMRYDIVSITSEGANSGSANSAAGPNKGDAKSSPRSTGSSARSGSSPNSDAVPRDASGRPMGVFYLPLEGMVGESFRHQEIEMIGEEADKYGPGQIIVLMVNSNGGLVVESELINETIWDLKKRHRVIAWVKKAISAGCSTAMACDEIYFMTEGTAGSVTTIVGMQHLPEEQVQPHIDNLAEVARRSGYSEHIARAMKLKKYQVSYDKDPVTGEVTWYNDLSGEFHLSTGEQNLCFNSSNAAHSGFAKGIADTEDQLAKMLDMPRWHEISTYGREIAKRWQDTVEQCKREVSLLGARREYKSAAGDFEERIGALIQINNQIMRWIDRCEQVCMLMGVPPKRYFERENEEYRKQLADYRRAQRR